MANETLRMKLINVAIFFIMSFSAKFSKNISKTEIFRYIFYRNFRKLNAGF